MREFSPAREEEVIVMQQVTEIYGRENGWNPFGQQNNKKPSAFYGEAAEHGGIGFLQGKAKRFLARRNEDE